MEHKVKIVAKDRKEFDTIEELLNSLHPAIYGQIERAEYGAVGLECYIQNFFEEVQQITLPKGVTQISHFGDYIGIYCGKYFFKIVLNEKDSRKFSYIFGYENEKEIENEN